MDERTLERWFALELGSVHDSLVTHPRPVTELLRRKEPALPTRSGASHRFDPHELQRLHDALRPHERHRLRVPIHVHLDSRTARDAYLQDEVAVRALKALGLVKGDRELRDGRLWLGRTLALDLARALPTTLQLVLR